MTARLLADFEMAYGGGPVIRASLEMPASGFSVSALLGPSGCGKTTVLRSLAGLERPARGTIRFGDEVWLDAGRGVFLTPQQRGIGLLFQDYALFPHLTVADNVAYGLRGMTAGERKRIVDEAMVTFGLEGLENRYPHQVSGGQAQRTALARVLVRRPRLLLLDEPLSALDSSMREQLRIELRRLLAQFRLPVVLVTHDRAEAIAMADQVVVLHQGAVRQSGPTEEVFNHPADLEVARIVGVDTVHAGRVVKVDEGLATIRIGECELVAVAPPVACTEVAVCIRGEEVMLQKAPAGQLSGRNRVRCRTVSIQSEGPLVRVGLDCGFALTALVTRPAIGELGLAVGDEVIALLKAPAIHLIVRD